MKRNTYPLHPDFKRYAKAHPPLFRPVLPFVRGFAALVYKRQKSDKELFVQKLKIPTRDGAGMRSLLYAPRTATGNLPCLIVYHGGGFVLPAAPYHYALAKEYAKGARCKVLFVNYRLAPKYKFPTAVHDCIDAYLYVQNNATALGVDNAKIAVSGDSAGGNLAAVVCLAAKLKNAPMPCGQMLLYPALSFDENTGSMQKYADAPTCSRRDARKFAALYLKKGVAIDHPYLSPTNAQTHEGLPPAYIETAEMDCLRDSAILYAEKLENSGVACTLRHTQGTPHAFDMAQTSAITRACVQDRICFLRKIF